MSFLCFSRASHTCKPFGVSHQLLGTWEAYNNVTSHSRGTWPDGTYLFSHWVKYTGLGVDSAYGSHGIFMFHVPCRPGMGVHAGRKHIGPKKGSQHPTMGRFRTLEEAMAKIQSTHERGSQSLSHHRWSPLRLPAAKDTHQVCLRNQRSRQPEGYL